MKFTSKKVFCTLFLTLSFSIPNIAIAEIEINEEILAPTDVQSETLSKFPDYSKTYLGEDKYENFNRKMFNMNLKFNKYALRPVHILWASIMPKYGMERIQNAYTNIQYPKRLLSSLIQRDFDTTKNETIRFLTNSTIGLGGMFDPANRLFNIEKNDIGMEEALVKCNVKQGNYLVVPWLSSTTPRGLLGTLLDNALNPSNYIGTPVVALAKIGFTVNNTYYLQPMLNMIESTYADPYDIAKKMYGLERYIKNLDLDKKKILETSAELAMLDIDNQNQINTNRGLETSFPNTIPPQDINPNMDKNIYNNDYQNIKPSNIDITPSQIKPGNTDDITDPPYNKNRRGNGISYKNELENLHMVNNDTSKNLKIDINLDNYYPQNPIIDAMRTALFEQADLNKSIWSEYSIWNRCFSKRIKTGCVNIAPNKKEYKFRYILQKDKSAPVAIIYPSIGEGATSHHSTVMAKMFYDEGYSVIIQGSHFQWEFFQSMPDGYKPGNPVDDINYIRLVTQKIVNTIENKHNCKLGEKTVIGTSFGALATLFLGDKESQENTLDINKYISINPPIELFYALKEIDKTTLHWQNTPNELKDKVAVTASKIIQLMNTKNEDKKKIDILPFTLEEAKLITGFVLHQKLSDLVFTMENTEKNKKTDIYKTINNMTYEDYANKYLVSKQPNIKQLENETSLYYISNYLSNNNNYIIYHTIDDYLVNKHQLSKLQNMARENLILINNGSHLGFLYRDEFINELKAQIKIEKQMIATK